MKRGGPSSPCQRRSRRAVALAWLRSAASLALLGCFDAATAAVPQRLVSLDLCTDWMLARYAEPARIAALSPMHRRFPVAWLDERWPTHDGSIEQIVEFAPDLIITGEYNALQLRSRLQALGFRVAVLALPTSLDTVTDYERQLLALLGRPLSAASTPPRVQKPPAVRKRLLLLGANGIGTGRGTFEDDILERAGWRNYLQGEGYLRLDLEGIATDAPDAILWAAPASRALANRFAEHRVLHRSIAPAHWLRTDYWRWQCPGPWTWELVEQLQRWAE